MRRCAPILAGLIAIALISPAAVGCADNQPGDVNNGPGYTNNVSDLLVKLPALLTDPCQGAQAPRIYQDCGRYVTEVANTISMLRTATHGQTATADALQTAVNTYQQLGCDNITRSPSALQQAKCPATLRTIGAQLNTLASALTSQSSGS